MGAVIGIDLGTSNTCAAAVVDGEVRPIPDDRGRTVTPSVLTQNRFGRFVVGYFAKAQQISNPYETIYSVKRLIGQDYDTEEMDRVRRYVSYPIERDERTGGVLIPLKGRKYTPTELSAQILLKIKEIAQSYLEEEVDKAVITVPAHFNDRQRRETKRAGEMAGLEVLRLINEPTAAALAFGFDNQLSTRVAVFDFGGGTFDISVLNIEGNIFEVVSTGGDSYLGGDDFNWRLVEYLAAEFLASDNINLKMDKMAMQRLLDAAEAAKITLSTSQVTVVDLPRIAPNIDINAHLHVSITRQQLEWMVKELVEDAIQICDATFKAGNLSPQDVDQVLMVGGQSKMPLVQQLARDFFKVPLNTAIDPEEVVAVGAAIQAQSLVEEQESATLLDVTPLTLGVGTYNDIFAPLIARNSRIPAKASKIFTTMQDNQKKVRIKAYQGENRVASKNQLLGEFVLEGIRDAPRMEPRINVEFRLDASGILNVTAHDLDTDSESGITITNYMDMAGQADLEQARAREESRDEALLDPESLDG